jgi:hypothetical protein
MLRPGSFLPWAMERAASPGTAAASCRRQPADTFGLQRDSFISDTESSYGPYLQKGDKVELGGGPCFP